MIFLCRILFHVCLMSIFSSSQTVAAGWTLDTNEDSAEIAARAARLDQNAIVLCVIGYTTGRYGFPKHIGLAASWNMILRDTGAVREAYLLLAFSFMIDDTAISDYPEQDWVRAKFAQASPLAELLRQKGIFSVEDVLTRSEKKIRESLGEHVNPEEEFAAQLSDMEDRVKRFHAYRLWSVDCLTASLPETGKETLTNFLNDLFDVPLRILALFHMATDGQSPPYAPRWRETLPLALLRQPKPYDGLSVMRNPLYDELLHSLPAFWGETDAGKVVDLMRRAHAGEREAAKKLAYNFFVGAEGFLPLPTISARWRRQCAELGDPECMLITSVMMGHLSSLREDEKILQAQIAWAWAARARESGDAAVASVAAAMQKSLESGMTPEELAQAGSLAEDLKREIEEQGQNGR
jgi:hypothetical protein